MDYPQFLLPFDAFIPHRRAKTDISGLCFFVLLVWLAVDAAGLPWPAGRLWPGY
jgi:hypothetical protein